MFSFWDKIKNPDGAILQALQAASKDGMSGAETSKATGILAGWIYPALLRMERGGIIKGAWVDAPYPRRRLYHLVHK